MKFSPNTNETMKDTLQSVVCMHDATKINLKYAEDNEMYKSVEHLV